MPRQMVRVPRVPGVENTHLSTHTFLAWRKRSVVTVWGRAPRPPRCRPVVTRERFLQVPAECRTEVLRGTQSRQKPRRTADLEKVVFPSHLGQIGCADNPGPRVVTNMGMGPIPRRQLHGWRRSRQQFCHWHIRDPKPSDRTPSAQQYELA